MKVSAARSALAGALWMGGAAVLAPWVQQNSAAPGVLVLQATLQQSRHEFAASLATLDRALAARPDDPQALLIEATVLRVLGRLPEAGTACERFFCAWSKRGSARCAFKACAPLPVIWSRPTRH